MNREHLERLTKAQLVDMLSQPVAEPWSGVDVEARAFHHCVVALDRVAEVGNRTTYSYEQRTGNRPDVRRVIGYLQDRYGVRDNSAALRAELERVTQQRNDAVQQLENIRLTVSGGMS